MKKIIFYNILLLSILFGNTELSDEQLDKIRSKTNNDDLFAPNFTLKSLESRTFSNIKSQIKSIVEGCEDWKSIYGNFPKDIHQMINNNVIKVPVEILIEWEFKINLSEEGIITAINSVDDIKLVYNVKEELFSFITSNESNMTFDSSISLDSLRGKVVLINFWATWCGPCRMEIPDFNELYAKYNDKGLEVLGISISDSREPLLKFKNAYNIFYPILYGDPYEMSKIQMEYGGVHSIPISFLIDKYGEVIRVYPGAIIKQFDPGMYTDLVMNIENALLK